MATGIPFLSRNAGRGIGEVCRSLYFFLHNARMIDVGVSLFYIYKKNEGEGDPQLSDNRIADHETRIKLLEKNDLYQDRMIEQLDRDIDTLTEMQLKTETELKLMGKDLEMINGTTSRTEDKLDKLAKQRDADHLILPLENVQWTKKQLLSVVIGIVLSFIFGAISANLGL